MKHRYWIFDMDGTLTDSMPIWAQVPYELVRSFGKVPAEDLGRVEGADLHGLHESDLILPGRDQGP